MFNKLKLNVAVILTAFSLVTVTVIAPYTNMFGKHYKNSMDFTCCKGDQLYVHHYFTSNMFWVEVGSGYTVEPIGKPTPGGCNIQCDE
ncbi:MAG: hypothetical protein KGL19_01060 [Bacteroidota bacterium]|nr:hypothetical protein [Bacteroidota bacterium]